MTTTSGSQFRIYTISVDPSHFFWLATLSSSFANKILSPGLSFNPVYYTGGGNFPGKCRRWVRNGRDRTSLELFGADSRKNRRCSPNLRKRWSFFPFSDPGASNNLLALLVATEHNLVDNYPLLCEVLACVGTRITM